jgi:hypothetical protein
VTHGLKKTNLQYEYTDILKETVKWVNLLDQYAQCKQLSKTGSLCKAVVPKLGGGTTLAEVPGEIRCHEKKKNQILMSGQE